MAAGDYQGAYSADKVVVTVGPVIVSGFADGDFVSASYNEDRVFPKSGADGEFGIATNPSRMGTITITLSATSAANDELSAVANLGNFGQFTAPIPISIADLSGRTLIAATKCWLQTSPEVTLSKEISDREWVFGAGDLLLSVGGNG